MKTLQADEGALRVAVIQKESLFEMFRAGM